MSYIAFDLDALNLVPSVAAAAGVRAGDITHGLLQLWAYCFRNEIEVVSEVHLKGFFGVDAAPSLEAFGFLEAHNDEWRVRGAQRYLRIKNAQREGGKKGRARSSSVIGKAEVGAEVDPGSTSRSTSRSTSGSAQALTPSTEHRAPNVETTLSSELDLGVPELPKPAPALEDRLTDDEFQVFEHWRVVCRHPKAKATPERKRLLAKALRVYSVHELQLAVSGVLKSPHHMGQNDRHTVYDDLSLILRDAKHIEMFQRLAGEP